MTPPVLIALLVELALAAFTILFLVRPKFFFKSQADSMSTSYTWIGVILFCLLFTWSVVFGVILRLTDYAA